MKCEKCLRIFEEENEMVLKPVYAKNKILLEYLLYFASSFLFIGALIFDFKTFITSLFFLNLAFGFLVFYKRKDYLPESEQEKERKLIGHKYCCSICGNEQKTLDRK